MEQLAQDETGADIASLMPTLKDFYGKKYMPKSAHKSRKAAALKMLKENKI